MFINCICIIGLIFVVDYMMECLLYFVYGYYVICDFFGMIGDFIIVLEIIQMFGEFLGILLV